MYNRYIPQSDGTYQRRRMQENIPQPKSPAHPQPSPALPCPPPEQPEPTKRPIQSPRPRPNHPHREPDSITGFLRHLLPKGFDTGDLLVVVLLLLMSGDCQEDQNTALLTLALYLFM